MPFADFFQTWELFYCIIGMRQVAEILAVSSTVLVALYRLHYSSGPAPTRVLRSSCLCPVVSSAHRTLPPALQHLAT